MPRQSIWQAKLAAPEAKVELVVVAPAKRASLAVFAKTPVRADER